MRLAVAAILILLLAAPALAHHQDKARVQLINTVELLRPIYPDAEEFSTAQKLVVSDLSALLDELGRKNPKPGRHFARLQRSLDILGDEGGYTSPYLKNIRTKRSLNQYRLLRSFVNQLEQQACRRYVC